MKNQKNIIFAFKVICVLIIGCFIIIAANLYRGSHSKPKDKTASTKAKNITENNVNKTDKNNAKVVEVKVKKSEQTELKLTSAKNEDFGRLNAILQPQGQSEYRKYDNQLTALHALKAPLLREEVELLRDYVRKEKDDRYTMHIKDEIFIKIESGKIADKSHIDFLTQLSADKTLDGELRGYAVQHLRSEYKKADAELRKQIQKTLFDSLKDTKSDVSGTAMLALADLSKLYPNEFDKEAINSELVSMVEDDSLHIPSRIAVVQSIGKVKANSESITNAVRDLAFNKSDDMTLRLTAIAAVGEIGSKEDIEQLEKILKNEHRLYKVATQKAIQKLKKNNNKI